GSNSTTHDTKQLLEDVFPGRLNSKSGSIDRPPRSVGPIAPDFFLWNFSKSKVYANEPTTIRQHKMNISKEIATLLRNHESSSGRYRSPYLFSPI
ncbi:hypothetical protein WH47_07200, partial [Habropoda laboriosa]